MQEEKPNTNQVHDEYEELKEKVKKYTIQYIISGDWFIDSLIYILESYAKKVNTGYFKEKYPNLPMDTIIKKRIKHAMNSAAWEGAISGVVYSGAIAAIIGSDGLTIPAAAISFVADLLYTTRLQLELAYDISVLYGKPVNLGDRDDVINFLVIAFGNKGKEILTKTGDKASPGVAKLGLKSVLTKNTLKTIKGLPLIGKYLLKKNIMKFSIPGCAIIFSAGVNYWSVGSISRVAHQIYHDEALIEKKTTTIIDAEVNILLLLKTILLVVEVDKKSMYEEIMLLSILKEKINLMEENKKIIEDFHNLKNLDKDEVLKQLRSIDAESANAIYDAACFAAAVDHKVHKLEYELLREIADACRVKYSKEHLDSYIKDGLV